MRRRAMASWAALLAAVALVTAGCADAPDSGRKTELVWAVGRIDAADEGPAATIAARWNEAHPEAFAFDNDFAAAGFVELR